jgi:outer membrane protein OmpA-like peptidoglycan-associated protein
MWGPVADSTKDHRPAWLPLAAAAIVVPTALAGLTLMWPRPQIESALTTGGEQALAAAGFPDARLTLTGRDATISGVPAAQQQLAIDAVQAVSGMRVATAVGAGAGAGTAQPAPFGVARRGEDVVLSGVAGSEAERAELVAAATAQAGGRTVVDELTVTSGEPLPPGVDAISIGTAAAAVAGASADLAVAIGTDGVTLSGTVPDDATKAAVAQRLTAAIPGSTVDNRLTVSAPAGGAAPGAPDAAAKQQLQSSVTALLAGSPISFEPNSSQLTAPGRATVERVVALLKPVPAVRVQVDGYVATGPGDGKLSAQQLSDQRAATVRDALVAGGVPAANVTATGKGEDTSSTSRAQGRRATISVV